MEFQKVCKSCKRDYISKARNQRYCTPECGILYQARLKKNRRFSNENKQLMRIKARSHSLAVEIVKFGLHTKGKPWQCEYPTCSLENDLEVHHKDLNFLNNTPSNLGLYCTHHHSFTHKILEDSLKKKNQTLPSFYNKSFSDYFKNILKGV